jgi:ribosome biogenesis GTPase A
MKVLAKKAVHPGMPGRKVLDLVDLFLFLVDARIPGTSVRLASPYLSRKKRVYVLAKPDLADPLMTARWTSAFAAEGTSAFAVDCRRGDGMDSLVRYIKERKEELDRKRPPGVTPRPIRLMLFGPPNAGKSSLANRLLGTTKAPFGARPGLTRGSHWLRGRGFLEVLDTPGVVDTSQVKGDARMKLAAVWALPETAYEAQELASWLVQRTVIPVTAEGGEDEAQAKAVAHLEDFGRRRGFLRQGGAVDLDRASKAFIHAFREGQIGGFTLEEPPVLGERAHIEKGEQHEGEQHE